MVTSRSELIDAHEIEIDGHKFIISRLPAWDAAPVFDAVVQSRGVIAQDDKLKILSRCMIITDNGDVVLDRPAIINNYIKKFQILNKLIDEAYELNFGSPESGSHSQE